MEVAFSTIKGLIGIGEVGSCVAMVAAKYNRRGTRYRGGRRGAAYRVRWGELLLNGERRTLNQYIVIHLSSRGSGLSTSGSIQSPAAHHPIPRTQLHTRSNSTWTAATLSISRLAKPSCHRWRSDARRHHPRANSKPPGTSNANPDARRYCREVAARCSCLSGDSHCSLEVCGIDSRWATRDGRTGGVGKRWKWWR
jgi:hypothetical protein